MIVKLWNAPHIIYQTADDGQDIPNSALGVHVDNGGTICISQEGDAICLNAATIPELCKLLKKLAAN